VGIRESKASKFGGMDVSEAKRLRQLEYKNAKLKKLLAEQMLDAAPLRELLSKNGRARRPELGSRASAGRTGPVRTAGLLHRQRLNCASNCESSPTTTDASAIGGCSCCCGNRVSHPG
jgi:hypothetical protein